VPYISLVQCDICEINFSRMYFSLEQHYLRFCNTIILGTEFQQTLQWSVRLHPFWMAWWTSLLGNKSCDGLTRVVVGHCRRHRVTPYNRQRMMGRKRKHLLQQLLARYGTVETCNKPLVRNLHRKVCIKSTEREHRSYQNVNNSW